MEIKYSNYWVSLLKYESLFSRTDMHLLVFIPNFKNQSKCDVRTKTKTFPYVKMNNIEILG